MTSLTTHNTVTKKTNPETGIVTLVVDDVVYSRRRKRAAEPVELDTLGPIGDTLPDGCLYGRFDQEVSLNSSDKSKSWSTLDCT